MSGQPLMKQFCVYILLCADGSYYTGHTDDLDDRFAKHVDGTFGGYTARRRPVKLAYHAECSTREEALSRERQLKGWSRAKKEALIQGDWAQLRTLSRGRSMCGTRPA